MEVLTPYIAVGILRGTCLCAQKPEALKRLVYDLRFVGIDTDREIRREALELRTEDEAYFINKRFEPHVMVEMLRRKIEERGIRASQSRERLENWDGPCGDATSA
jgi:hypothetical protein